MAATVLTDVEVTVNGVDLSDRVKSVSVPMSAATQDVTTMGDSWTEQLAGVRSWSVTIEFLQDFATDKTHATIWPIFGTKVAITVKPTSATMSATNPELRGNVIISEYNPLEGAVGDASTTSVTWPGTGAMTVATEQKVVGYFPIWNANAGYDETDVDFSIVSIVAHFAVEPQGDGTIDIPDWGPYPDPDLITAAHAAGSKVVLVIGGDHEAARAGFSTLAATSGTRDVFVAAAVALVSTHSYDGIDIDWEFPADADDRTNLTALVSELRAALPSDKTLSMACPASDWSGQWFDVPALVPNLDWMAGMSYALHASGWSGHSGHNAALYSPDGDDTFHFYDYDNLSLTSVMDYYLGRGVPRSKLLLGVPFFGQRFDDADAMYETLTGTAGAALGYTDIDPLIGTTWTSTFDGDAGAPYLLLDAGSGVLSYDDPASTLDKCEFTTAQRLGGVILWHLGQDVVGSSQPLLEAVPASMTP